VGWIAWPAVIPLGAWIFRAQIRGLLERPMRRWKAGPFVAEYEWANVTERVGTSVLSIKTVTGGRDQLDELLEAQRWRPSPRPSPPTTPSRT
jgi:hypothetical protein